MVRGRPALATFFIAAPLAPGARLTLDHDAAHHARVRRLSEGDAIRLTNGAGERALAVLSRLLKASLAVDVEAAEQVPPPPPVHLLVPVGDRDRMLWLAEKASELGVTSWQSVRFERSRSVAPRGEGPAFLEKVRSRMIAALEQSGGAWLAEILPETDVVAATGLHPASARLLLDQGGSPILRLASTAPAVVALGPEGGMTPEERAAFVTAGWLPAALGMSTLRFETAAMAAVAVMRAALDVTREG